MVSLSLTWWITPETGKITNFWPGFIIDFSVKSFAQRMVFKEILNFEDRDNKVSPSSTIYSVITIFASSGSYPATKAPRIWEEKVVGGVEARSIEPPTKIN